MFLTPRHVFKLKKRSVDEFVDFRSAEASAAERAARCSCARKILDRAFNLCATVASCGAVSMLQPDQLQHYEDMFALIARQLRLESGVDGEEAAHDWDALLSKIDQACSALQGVALPHFEKDGAAPAIVRTEG